MLVFEKRGKPEYSEKNVWEQRREPTTNSTHIWRRRRDLNPGHIGGRQALSPLRHSLLPFLNATANPSLFILLMINNYISFVEKTNLIKSLLNSSCQLLSQRFKSPMPNWRNIVGQWPGCYMLRPFAHPVACCCVRVFLGPEYLRKVWNRSNFLWNSWSLKRSATLLDPFVQLSQHSWGLARVWGVVYKASWAASFPRYTEGSSIVGNCCIRLRITANTDITTPNIVGPTVLEVVASVCT